MAQFPNITYRISCPHTPEQNGLAERKHRHVTELSLASMFHAAIPLSYWDLIFESIVFIINRLPSGSQPASSPFQRLFNKAPDYSFLHVLGCACYPLLRPYAQNKLQPRSDKCIFLGYSQQHKGYYCFHLSSNRMYISRHVIFDETEFPFQTCGTSASVSADTDTPPSSSTLMILPSQEPAPSPQPSSSTSTSDSDPPPAPPAPVSNSPQFSSSNSHFTPVAPTHSMLTRTKTKTLKPKTYTDHHVYLTAAATHAPILEPTCFSQAVKHQSWRDAMAAELTALANNSTWELVPPPAGAHIIGAKWIYKLKYKPDGTVDRHKARLVAKGYTQQEGVDYVETFSPVVKPTTIRVILTIALSKQWPLHQLDVNNAFLHGDLEETVFMEQPPGFLDPLLPHHVCRLKKALYGLKQAPRAWFHKLRAFLLSQHFISSQADTSLFILNHADTILFLLVYVDDLIITGNSPTAISSLLQALDAQFSIKDLGQLHYFLGIEVTQLQTSLHLSQTRYLQNILSRTSMLTAKPCTTPMQAGLQPSKFTGTPLSDPLQYRSIVGALQYATITRPDLSFSVNKLSQFMANPTDTHWALVKRVLRYIQGTLNHGLLLHSSSTLDLHAYCDADWAGCLDDRRSTTGFAVYLGSNLVSWCSKKQCTVSKSSTEAEYRSLAVTTQEVLWLTSLLSELKCPPSSPPILWCDNLGATFLASNPVFHARTKHIELDFHFVREKINSKQLAVRFICSSDQIGDVFTKSLAKARFALLRDKLHVLSNPSRLRGRVEDHPEEILDAASEDSNGDEQG